MHTDKKVTIEEVMATARSWVGVPYKHQGRSRRGVDCGGLLLCIGRDLGVRLLEPSVEYSMSPDPEIIEKGITDNCTLVSNIDDIRPGDIIHFSFAGEPRHVGMATDIGVIHSWAKPKKVVEHRIDTVWKNRIINIYRPKAII